MAQLCSLSGKKSVLPDDNFKFVVRKIFPKYANIVLLFIQIYMPEAEVVLLNCAALMKQRV
jgi:hypothetical protein